MTRSRLLSTTGLAVGLCLIGFGCGPSAGGGNSARVSGTLSYKGTPIKSAVMNFYNSDGMAYSATVSPDGTYQASDIAAGELVVTVETESLKKHANVGGGKDAQARMAQAQATSKRPDMPGGGNAAPPEDPATYYIKLPAKYAKASTSTKTVTLKPGRNVINIDLED